MTKNNFSYSLNFKKDIDKLNTDLTSVFDILSLLSNSSGSFVRNISAIGGAFVSLSNPLKVLTIGLSAFSGVFEATMNSAVNGEKMADLAAQSGMAVDKFQTLSNAVKHYGGTADSVANTMLNLRKNLQDVQSGGNGNGLLEFLSKDGINISGIKSAEQLLQIVAREMENLDSIAEKLDLGQALGLDDATIRLVSGGLANLNNVMADSEKYNSFSDEDIEQAQEFEATLRDISSGFSAIANNLGSVVLPILQPMFSLVKKIVDFYASNEENLSMLVKELSFVLGGVLLPILIAIVAAEGSALAPILAIIVAVAFLIAIFSVINAALLGIRDWVLGAHPLIEGLKQKCIEALEYLIRGFRKLADFVVEFIHKLPERLAKLRDAAETLFYKLANCAVQIFHKIVALISKRFHNLIGIVKDVVGQILQFLPEWLVKFLKQGGTVGLLIRAANKGKDAVLGRDRKSATAAAGLDYVPYDGYVAELHKGESVLNKSESNVWRDLMLGKDAIAATANITLASIPQGAIAGAYSNSTTTKNFTIGDITIQTQATDAEGIANDLLQNIKMAFNGLDTGVRA